MFEFNKVVEIDGVKIGHGQPCYVVADVSANHNADLGTAKKFIRTAKDIGLSAIKFQTYTVEKYLSKKVKVKDGYRLNEFFQEAKKYELPYEWHQELFSYARDLGITMFSTIDDIETIDFLNKLNTPAFKISSPDLNFLPMIEEAAKTFKPIILSTGVGDLLKINEAVASIASKGNDQLILLHCVSSYPAYFSEMNMRCINSLQSKFNLPVGLSDHTPAAHDPYSAALGAVALGANMIEKHITFSRSQNGPDHAFSMEPDEFEKLVIYIRDLEGALGNGRKRPTSRELKVLTEVTKSIHVTRDIKAGEILREDDLRILRPGYGIEPKHLKDVIGMKAKVNIEDSVALEWDLIEKVK